MNILVTGGTGFVGRPLCRALRGTGHSLTVLTRNASAAKAALGEGIDLIPWKPDTGELPPKALKGVQAVVNLAGESIGAGRWTEARKRSILSSRVQTTRGLVEVLQRAGERPSVLVSASAVGFYGPRGDEEVTEADRAGDDFLARVCVAWESEARKAEALGMRVVLVRLGVVLGEGGGALDRMVSPFRLYAGGPVGSGRQWFPWIHRDDVIGIIRWALEHPDIRGPVNATAPAPVRMRDFSRALGQVMRRPSWLPVPSWLLYLALGEMAGMLVNGQRVLPRVVLEAGYSFRFGRVEEALRDIFGNRRWHRG